MNIFKQMITNPEAYFLGPFVKKDATTGQTEFEKAMNLVPEVLNVLGAMEALFPGQAGNIGKAVSIVQMVSGLSAEAVPLITTAIQGANPPPK